MIIKRTFLFYLLLVSLFALTACEPPATLFDVPICTWENLTSSEKIDAMEAYQQKKNIEAQNSPNIFRGCRFVSPEFTYCHGWP